jgi:hypothetical protein
MALTSTSQLPIDAFGDISFLMQDGERVVRVDVSKQLLARIESLGISSSERLVAGLEKHRATIERIAIAKYGDGNYQSYANSDVIPITPADWRLAAGHA